MSLSYDVDRKDFHQQEQRGIFCTRAGALNSPWEADFGCQDAFSDKVFLAPTFIPTLQLLRPTQYLI